LKRIIRNKEESVGGHIQTSIHQ